MRAAHRGFGLVLAAVTIVLSGCNGSSTPKQSEAAGEQTYADAMSGQHAGETPVANPLSRTPAAGETSARMVEYATVQGRPVSGYLAFPAEFDDILPSVIVIHEWWGLNDNIKAMADRLAADGYLVLAVDLYGGAVADSAEAARTLMQEASANQGSIRTNLRSAYNYLAGTAGTERIGTLGWCFGGAMSLQAALLLPTQIDATVIYYGRLETDPAVLEPLQMPILGIFGAEDKGIPLSQVRAFESALAGLGKDADIRVYEGADHAFANPSGERYQAEAAEDAWRRTVAFLDEHLKN